MMSEAAIWVEEDGRDHKHDLYWWGENVMQDILTHTKTTCQLFFHKKIYS